MNDVRCEQNGGGKREVHCAISDNCSQGVFVNSEQSSVKYRSKYHVNVRTDRRIQQLQLSSVWHIPQGRL